MHVHGLGWHRPTERAEHVPFWKPDGARGVGRRVQVGKVLFSCTLHRRGLVSGDSDVINVRFGLLCGLKSDILRGPRSAKSRHYAVQQFDAVPTAVDADQEADLIIRRRQRIADHLASEVGSNRLAQKGARTFRYAFPACGPERISSVRNTMRPCG